MEDPIWGLQDEFHSVEVEILSDEGAFSSLTPCAGG